MKEQKSIRRLVRVASKYDWLLLYLWAIIVIGWQVDRPIPGGTIIAIVVPVFVYLRYGDGQQPLKYLRLVPEDQLATIGWAVMLGSIFAGITLTKAWLYSEAAFYWQWSWQEWISLVLTSCVVEEIFFRGFILQKLTQMTGFAIANGITAALFTASHGFVWWADSLNQVQWVTHAAYILVLGWLLGYVFRASRTLWIPIMIHGVNNMVALITIRWN
jgi:hypothetical protein